MLGRLTRGSRLWLALIVGCGFIVRVIWVFAMPYFMPVAMQADPQEYNQLAKNLLSGEGYRLKGLSGHFAVMGDHLNEPTARRPPLYPLVVAGIYWLVGERYRVVFLLQCVFDVVTMLAVFALARRLFGQVRIGLLASGLVACYPPFLQQNIVLMTESLAMVLMTLCFLALIQGLKTPGMRWFMLAGVLLGAAALARSEMLLFCLLLTPALILLLRRGGANWRSALLLPLVMFLCFWATVCPWVVRNALVFGRFIPGTTNTGSVLLEGLQMGTLDISKGPVHIFPEQTRQKIEGLDEVQANDVLLKDWFRLLLSDPWVWLRDAPRKVVMSWLNAAKWGQRYLLYYPTTSRNHYVQYTLFVPNVLLLLFAGLAIARYRGLWLWSAAPILLVMAVFTFANTFTMAQGRTCTKLMPAVMVLAAFGLCKTFNRNPKKKSVTPFSGRPSHAVLT